ncbi:F-box protein SKIP23-like [Vicia villosa]|uniref:F-box protein SKIP23-like n=1 Tax=Vicia villosa TaxID=3911 RepID=UPI00273B2514|nr:F-box protein SKIP23-like [Vicia villosa]
MAESGRSKLLPELLLVDMQPYVYENDAIKVYYLQESQRTWYPLDVSVTQDLVLFLGDDICFAATIAQLGIARGNCVIFMDGPFRRYTNPNMPMRGMSMVFLDDEDGLIGTISPEFRQLFWPPRAWTSMNEVCVVAFVLYVK